MEGRNGVYSESSKPDKEKPARAAKLMYACKGRSDAVGAVTSLDKRYEKVVERDWNRIERLLKDYTRYFLKDYIDIGEVIERYMSGGMIVKDGLWKLLQSYVPRVSRPSFMAMMDTLARSGCVDV